ncbi:MAG: GIY-YIG nuclease family protein [Candidatus Levyibacteriota bacterium]|jgi:putative endonuclease
MKYTVYILRTSSNTLYIGQTNNLEKRIKEHQAKTIRSSKYVRSFPSFELVYCETFKTRSEALKREYELKQLSKVQKEKLIQGLKP